MTWRGRCLVIIVMGLKNERPEITSPIVSHFISEDATTGGENWHIERQRRPGQQHRPDGAVGSEEA